MAAPTAAGLTRWAEGHHPDQTKLTTDTTKPKGPVSLIVARLRRFNFGTTTSHRTRPPPYPLQLLPGL